MVSKFAPTLPGNPNQLAVNQHIFPRSAIRRFAAADGLVEVDRFTGETFRAKPTNELFCAQRVWDQASETTRSATIEQAYASLADRIDRGEVNSLSDEMHKTVTEFYLLWNHRFGVAQLPAEDLTLNIAEVDRKLTKEQEEILEGKGAIFIRGNKVPIRFINGMVIMRENDRGMERMANARWGIVRASQGEFLVPDNTKELSVVPLSPNICLVNEASDQELSLKLVGAVNRQLRDCAQSYCFARDFRLCPIRLRTLPT